MAAVVEQSHDDYGPVWPLSIAPFEVHLCALNLNKPGVEEAAEKMYFELTAAGVEVLYDNRNEKAGSAFSDADLIGAPFRIVVSPRNLAENKVEFRRRGGEHKEMLSQEEAVAHILSALAEARRA
jgi:prolyl-tRNA synthetase